MFPQSHVGENLKAASFRRPNGAAERLELVLGYFPILHEFLDRPAGVLSGGQLQILVIGMALMLQPKLLLLDEPSLGLSPVMVQSVFEIVERLHSDLAMTVVVAEQTVPRLMEIAHDVYVLSRGRVALHAPPGEVTGYAASRSKAIPSDQWPTGRIAHLTNSQEIYHETKR